jgi:hypothetical protein
MGGWFCHGFWSLAKGGFTGLLGVIASRFFLSSLVEDGLGGRLILGYQKSLPAQSILNQTAKWRVVWAIIWADYDVGYLWRTGL